MKAISTARWSKIYTLTSKVSFGPIIMIVCLFIIGMRTTNAYGQTYCIPPQSLHSTTVFYVSNVNTTGGLSNFTNTTGAETASYGDYSSTKIASQTQGLPITISATNVSPTGNYGMDYNVYVDYNDNGVFNDPGELVLQMGNTYVGTSSGSFTIPVNAPPGTHKMRIRAEISDDLLGGDYPKDPCTQLQYGETEDYGLTVTVPCIPPTMQATIQNYTNNTSGNNITVNWTRGNGDNVMIVGRLTGTALSNPVSGTSYGASTIFGSGAKTGTGNFVIYNGTATNVNVTGLIPEASYTFTCYEYKSGEVCYTTPGSGLAVIAGVYCVPPQSSNNNFGSYISNVTTTAGITNFINTTGAETASYGNYSSTKIASQAQGSPLNIFATNTIAGMNYNVYIDYNDNGVFTDPGELVLQMGNDAAGTVAKSFTIPDNAPLGTHRMRVRADGTRYGYPPNDPCAQLDLGETEDYGLTVTASTGDYCLPGVSNFYYLGYHISNVTTTGGITNFTNDTGIEPSSYGNYSSNKIASQAQNLPITISATSPTVGMYYNVYVDYNDNKVFTDPGELVLQISQNYAGTVSGSFNIPAEAPPGTHRMRVRGEYSGLRSYPTSPCGPLQYGETEDYGLTVTTIDCTSSPVVSSPAAVCAGGTATALSVTASGSGTLHYQWYSNTTNSNSGGSVIGTDASTYTPAVFKAGTYFYYVIVTSDCGTKTSTVATVVVNPNTAITTDVSSPSAICAGGTAPDLSVTATGTGTLHYKWYSNTTNSNNGGSIIGTDASTYTPDVSVAGTYYYYVVVNSDCGNTTSSVATVIVNPNIFISIDVSSPDPVCAGTTAPRLSVTASGTGTLQYHWYRNTTNSNSGGSAIGTDASTYTPDVSTAGTYYYYVIISSDCGTTTSAVVTVVVNPNTAITTEVTTTPYSIDINGTAPVLNVVAEGSNLNYQWYSNTSNNNNNGSLINGATTATYTPPVNAAGTSYYYVVVSGDCGSKTSSVATVAVNAAPVAGTIGGSTSVCSGTNSTNLTVSGYTGTIQWQSSTVNASFTNISDATGSSYTATDLTETMWYRVVVSSGSKTATSESVAVTVTPNASAGTVTAGTTPQCIRSTTTYSVSGAVLSGGTGAWSSSNTLVATVDQSGNVTAVGAGQCNITYMVTGGCNGPATASKPYVVNPITQITASPSDATAPALDNTSFTVAASGTGTLGYQWQVSTDAGNSFTNLADNTVYSGTSTTALNLTGVAYTMNGYEYQCFVKGTCGDSTSTPATLTVTKRPTVITYTGDNNEQYSDQQTFTATLIDKKTSGALTSQPVSFTLGIQSVATATDGTGTATSTLNMYQDAGAYNVVSSFAGDNTYAASSDTDPFIITKENAITDYTGPEFISVPCATCATTPVLLSASVIDTSALYLANDKYPGDIRKARVKFINLDNMQDISGWLTPGLVNEADTTSGIVSYTWTVNLPTTGYDVYTIGVVVDNNGSAGNYIGTSQSVLSVSRSSLTQFITGGGHLVPASSGGQYASDAGRKVNFGFNVKYNKTGKNLQGNMNIIFRRTGHVYQIKATSMTSLSVNTTNPCSQKASFVSKANLIDITDENNPVSVYGGITLQTTFTDNGEPGTNDLIGITLLDNNTLIYSSNWVSKKTTEMLLNGGNLVVNSGVVCSNTIASRNEAVMVTEQTAIPSAISANAYPNPLRDQTSIVYTLPATMHINLAVYDIMGKKIAELQDASETAGVHTVKFDTGNHAAGVYFYSLTALDDKGKLTVINGKLIIGR
jgi:hypothetical protein